MIKNILPLQRQTSKVRQKGGQAGPRPKGYDNSKCNFWRRNAAHQTKAKAQ